MLFLLMILQWKHKVCLRSRRISRTSEQRIKLRFCVKVVISVIDTCPFIGHWKGSQQKLMEGVVDFLYFYLTCCPLNLLWTKII